MRTLGLLTLLLAAKAAAVCTANQCTCFRADFTAVGVLHHDGSLTLGDARWADGGVAAVDAGTYYSTSPWLDVPLETQVVIGAEFSTSVLPLEAWPLTDAGLVACQGGTYSLAAWRDALATGSCVELTPPRGGPCRDTGRCSTTGGLSVLAIIALLARRSTRRLSGPARGTTPRTRPSSLA